MSNHHIAFVFPGQGSQKVGMLTEMAAANPIVEQTFAEASAVLGYDLWNLVHNGAQTDLNLTERTQPILLTASVALWRIWCEKTPVRPKLMAGHSLGEWSALVCAGVIDFAAAVKLVQQRGMFMQAAVPEGEGAMAAVIGLEAEVIKNICTKAACGDVLAPVNFNSPEQTVIAGAAAAVERAIVLCRDAKAKRAILLPVSAPFHTEMMRPAAEKLALQIEQTRFNTPKIPIVHNVHAQVESDSDTIKALMIEQIYSPVRWVDCVNNMVADGIEVAVECGPGKVLSGLNKRIVRSLRALTIETPAELDNAVFAFNQI